MFCLIKGGLGEDLTYAKKDIWGLNERIKTIQPAPCFNGVQIKNIREKIEFSQKDMAGFMGVTLRTVKEWENNKSLPNGACRRLLEILEQNPKFANDF